MWPEFTQWLKCGEGGGCALLAISETETRARPSGAHRGRGAELDPGDPVGARCRAQPSRARWGAVALTREAKDPGQQLGAVEPEAVGLVGRGVGGPQLGERWIALGRGAGLKCGQCAAHRRVQMYAPGLCQYPPPPPPPRPPAAPLNPWGRPAGDSQGGGVGVLKPPRAQLVERAL